MTIYDEICKAANYARGEFETALKRELGEDFGVNCPSCGERLDNEDEINSDNTCWYCDNTSDVSVV